jgi:hypothetical protein
MTWWLGASAASDGPADHALLSLVDGLDVDFLCTHVDRGHAVARAGVTVRLAGEADVVGLAERLGQVATVAGPPDGARCVRFPGQEALTGVLPAADIVAASAIDEVVGVGVPVTPDSSIDTRGFLRPTFAGRKLVLLVEPAAGGVLRPVEIADPHQCCGGH